MDRSYAATKMNVMVSAFPVDLFLISLVLIGVVLAQVLGQGP